MNRLDMARGAAAGSSCGRPTAHSMGGGAEASATAGTGMHQAPAGPFPVRNTPAKPCTAATPAGAPAGGGMPWGLRSCGPQQVPQGGIQMTSTDLRRRRRRYPYPRALRRIWRHPKVQAMNNHRLRLRDDLRDRLEYWARYRARFRSGYDRGYYTARDIPECRSYDARIIRPGDMGAAILYAFGIDSYDDVSRILSIPLSNPRHIPAAADGSDARSQAALLASHMRRSPRLAVDMGCGRGEIACTLAHLGIDVLAVDPSAHAGGLVRETAHCFYGQAAGPTFLNKGCHSALSGMRTTPDTVIFCESIEHIPEKDIWRSFDTMSRMAASAPFSIRIVVTNWIDFHPIRRVGRDWDHLHDVDDEFYDRLEAYADRTVLRQGSHLVLELGMRGRQGE